MNEYSIGDLVVRQKEPKIVLVVTQVSADSVWLNDQCPIGKSVRYLACDIRFWQNYVHYKVVK